MNRLKLESVIAGIIAGILFELYKTKNPRFRKFLLGKISEVVKRD